MPSHDRPGPRSLSDARAAYRSCTRTGPTSLAQSSVFPTSVASGPSSLSQVTEPGCPADADYAAPSIWNSGPQKRHASVPSARRRRASCLVISLPLPSGRWPAWTRKGRDRSRCGAPRASSRVPVAQACGRWRQPLAAPPSRAGTARRCRTGGGCWYMDYAAPCASAIQHRYHPPQTTKNMHSTPEPAGHEGCFSARRVPFSGAEPFGTGRGAHRVSSAAC